MPAAPQTLALCLKALKTRRSRAPAADRSGQPDAARHATEELEMPTDHPLVRRLLRHDGLYVWIAAAKNHPRKQGRELYPRRARRPNSE